MPSHVLGFDLRLTRHFAHHQRQMRRGEMVSNAWLLPTLLGFEELCRTRSALSDKLFKGSTLSTKPRPVPELVEGQPFQSSLRQAQGTAKPKPAPEQSVPELVEGHILSLSYLVTKFYFVMFARKPFEQDDTD